MPSSRASPRRAQRWAGRHLRESIRAIRRELPSCRSGADPDFRGVWRRCRRCSTPSRHPQPQHRNGAAPLLGRAAQRIRAHARAAGARQAAGHLTKTGIMIGIASGTKKIYEVMRDLRRVECDVLPSGNTYSRRRIICRWIDSSPRTRSASCAKMPCRWVSATASLARSSAALTTPSAKSRTRAPRSCGVRFIAPASASASAFRSGFRAGPSRRRPEPGRHCHSSHPAKSVAPGRRE